MTKDWDERIWIREKNEGNEGNRGERRQVKRMKKTAGKGER